MSEVILIKDNPLSGELERVGRGDQLPLEDRVKRAECYIKSLAQLLYNNGLADYTITEILITL